MHTTTITILTIEIKYIYLTDNGKTKLLSIIDNFVSDDFSINDLIVNENRIVINASTSSKTVTKIPINKQQDDKRRKGSLSFHYRAVKR